MSRPDEQPGARPDAPRDGRAGRQARRPHDDPHAEPDVVSITSVPESLADEQSRRMRVYVIQMLVRVACFLGAVVVTNWPVRIVLIVGAVVLPYTAVIFANASGERRTTGSVGMAYRELPAAPEPTAPRVIDVPAPDPTAETSAGRPDATADGADHDGSGTDGRPDEQGEHESPGHAA